MIQSWLVEDYRKSAKERKEEGTRSFVREETTRDWQSRSSSFLGFLINKKGRSRGRMKTFTVTNRLETVSSLRACQIPAIIAFVCISEADTVKRLSAIIYIYTLDNNPRTSITGNKNKRAFIDHQARFTWRATLKTIGRSINYRRTNRQFRLREKLKTRPSSAILIFDWNLSIFVDSELENGTEDERIRSPGNGQWSLILETLQDRDRRQNAWETAFRLDRIYT